MRTKTFATLTTIATLGLAAGAQAHHAWDDLHWARATNPFTLQVRNSTSDTRTFGLGQNWPALLAKSVADWSRSPVLDLAVAPPTTVDLAARAACAPQTGAIRVCNAPNPDVLWLGLATVYGADSQGHISAATAQMNDTWFSSPFYDTTNAQHVMCQEVGHTFGLAHQDESGADLGTCMDYANALDNPNPNAHDYEQIEVIYNHGDGARAGRKARGRRRAARSGRGAAAAWSPVDLGLPRGYHGRGHHGRPHAEVFVTREHGMTVRRFVLWAH